LVKVLSGHRRTPWVVRFHPRKPTLLSSGSLDHEVRLWDAETGQCIARHMFGGCCRMPLRCARWRWIPPARRMLCRLLPRDAVR